MATASTAPVAGPSGGGEEEEKEQLRFFTADSKKKRTHGSRLSIGEEDEESISKNKGGEGDFYGDLDEDDEAGEGRCLTLRVLQKALPCLKKKSIWEPSMGDVYKTQEVEETKYPTILKVLESKVFDVIFVVSCLASIYLFFFSEGFIMESKAVWGIIHIVNSIYIFCLFGQWLEILIKTRYSKTNRGYTRLDVLFTLLCIFPADLIVLAIYTLTDTSRESVKPSLTNSDPDEQEDDDSDYLYYITLSRLNYLLRIFDVVRYFSNWENQLAVGDFFMFIIRIGLYIVFFIHTLACVWHRIACKPFELEHFKMKSSEATSEVCEENSWIMILLKQESPLLNHPDMNVLFTHYLVSLYWAVTTSFRLGYGDITIYLTTRNEIIFTCVAQISGWILTMATVSGTLTSLLIESDTERENFLTRRLAIKYYLNFSFIPKSIIREVTNYYDHLWLSRKGIFQLTLIDKMPLPMKAGVFYDINKDVFDQLPLLKDIDEVFIVKLAVHMTHQFFLEGEILFKKHEIGNCMYYVLKGYLEILSVDGTQSITNIQSQSVIGEIFLVQSYPHAATVRCGSDCEIISLKKQNFKQVVALYPHYADIFRQRIEERLEDSNIILSLCEKHNDYVPAFAKLHQHRKFLDFGSDKSTKSSPLISFPPPEATANAGLKPRTEGDIDELLLPVEVMRRYSMAHALEKEAAKETQKHIRRSSLEEAAFSALEMDVNRAGTLAKDLGILIPPIIVSAPVSSKSNKTVVSTGQSVTENVASKVGKVVRGRPGTLQYFVWKSIVSLCVLMSIWFYLHEWGFNSEETRKWNYFAHILDGVVAIDFCFDMLQIVVLSTHRTLENSGEILIYRFHTSEFYIRLFGFLPWEYIVSAIFKLDQSFYLLKLNRCLELTVVATYFQGIEGFARAPILIFLIKFTVISLYVIHFFAVVYGVILREVLKTSMTSYVDALYWSTQIITSTGFGDLTYSSDEEIVVLTIGLIIGTGVLTYLGAKIAAILANSERRRVAFKQKYYAVKQFMEQRHFPKKLANRVTRYYDIQWKAHQGVLIPTEKLTAIWDAPETIIERVALAQCQRFTTRSPIIRYASIERQKKFCKLLKQYFVPPGEIILYPEDRRRELYIIARGFCEVYSGGTLLGILSEGHYFGLAGLINGVNLNYLIKTKTHCQFLCLHFHDFVTLTRQSPSLLREYRLMRGEIVQNTKNGSNWKQREKNRESKSKNLKVDYVIQEENPLVDHEKILSAKEPVDPFGIRLTGWVIFRTIFSVMVTVFVTSQACFAFHPLESLIVMLIFDIVAWIDIVIMVRLPYYGEHGQLILDYKQTAKRYLKRSFVLDLCASIPLEWGLFIFPDARRVFSLGFSNYNYGGNTIFYLMSFMRLNRVAQCYRLFIAENYFEHNIFHSLSLITLVEVMPIMFLFIHVMACISILVVCNWSSGEIPLSCPNSSWIRNFIPLNPVINETAEIDESAWLPKPDYELDPYTMYTIGIYWVTQCAVNVGFGDILMKTFASKCLAIFIILSGCIISQYLGSKLTACLVGEDSRRIMLRHKMTVMFGFLSQFKVSKTTQWRVEQMYYNAWDKTKGVFPSDLFVALHPSLKADVTKQLYEEKLRKSPLLKDLDDSGIRMLSSRLEEKFYPEGEYIIRYGDLNDDVFIIASGIISAYNSKGHILVSLASGSLIGEISALFEVERLYSVKAATDVDLFLISRANFMDFLSTFPDIKSTLEIACFKHLKESWHHTRPPSGELKLSSQIHGNEFDSGAVRQWSFLQDVKKAGSTTVRQNGVSEDEWFHQELVNEPDSNADRDLVGDTNTVVLEAGSSSTSFDPLRVGINTSPSKRFVEPRKDQWTCPCLITFGSCPKQDMGLIHIVQEKNDVSFLNFAIHPASRLCSASTSVCLFLLITCASCSIISFELAFTTDHEDTTSLVLNAIRWSLEAFFYIRFMGLFFLAYYDDINGVLVSDVKAITYRLTTRFYGLLLAYELASVVPFADMARLFKPAHEAVVVTHVRSIKLLRVVLFIKYLNDAESDLRMKASNVKIIKISIIFCFIFHFCACAWYVVACYGSDCIHGSWVERTAAQLENGIPKLIDGKENITVGDWYFFSLFYVTTAVTFTGLNNIQPSTLIELWITIFYIFATIFIIGYLIGEMTQCLSSQVNHKIHYQHELVVLEEHFKNVGLPKARCHEIHEYYKMLYRKCKGISYSELLGKLPYPLRADIGFEIFGPNVKSSRLLHRMEEYILRQICARITFEIYLPGSHIIRNGDVCEAMYFIKRGEVVILEQNQNLELCVEILYENECFGEVKLLLPQEQFHFSYIARLESEVGVLSRKDLDEVITNYPALEADLRERATKIKFHRMNIQAEEERQNKSEIVEDASIPETDKNKDSSTPKQL